MSSYLTIDNQEVVIAGRLFKRGRLRAEYYDTILDPAAFFRKLQENGACVDLFSFLQSVADRTPRFQYHQEPDAIAVLPITTYEAWWKSLKDKTRNMVRKAAKNGVEIRAVEFNDELVAGIKLLYDESPIRQGKPFKHYGKSLEVLKRDHASYLDRSDFIGAFFEGKLIGFIKLVQGNQVANLMQILSFMSFRDKAPTNALIARAVEICAQRQVPHLHYGMWSRRGIGEFKINHRFECMEIPRYFVPLSRKGELLLKVKLHHQLSDYVPEKVLDAMTAWRAKWYGLRYKQAASGR